MLSLRISVPFCCRNVSLWCYPYLSVFFVPETSATYIYLVIVGALELEDGTHQHRVPHVDRQLVGLDNESPSSKKNLIIALSHMSDNLKWERS